MDVMDLIRGWWIFEVSEWDEEDDAGDDESRMMTNLWSYFRTNNMIIIEDVWMSCDGFEFEWTAFCVTRSALARIMNHCVSINSGEHQRAANAVACQQET